MNLEIIGLLKINERLPERVEYFFDTLESYKFTGARIQIMLDSPSDELYDRTGKWLENSGLPYELFRITGKYIYGELYSNMLATCKKGYVANMIEDCVSLIQDPQLVDNMLFEMTRCGAEVMRASFHCIELNSLSNVETVKEHEYGWSFDNNADNFKAYEKYYHRRFYAGVNWITTLHFAKSFWGRYFNSPRPHDWEISRYNETFRHIVYIPKQEFFCSIEDDHGEPNTCLLNRPNHPYWNDKPILHK